MRSAIVLFIISFALASCDGAGGSGTLEFTVWGEDFIEQEIPAANGPEEEGFVDGWTVTFSRFLLGLGQLTVADHNGVNGAEDAEVRIYDMHLPGPHSVVTFEDVEAQRWDRVSVSILPANDTTVAANATVEDVELMQDNGWSVYAEGQATRGDETIGFAWGFSTATSYGDCHHDDFGEGVLVPNGGVESAEITIHGDHLFYDDLQSPDTVLRFDAIASADDGDGEVTLEELSGVDLTTLTEGTYGTGGVGSVEDLGAFITALTRTLVHWRGEGHCSSQAQ